MNAHQLGPEMLSLLREEHWRRAMAYDKLARGVAWKYRWTRVPPDELLDSAREGVLRAAIYWRPGDGGFGGFARLCACRLVVERWRRRRGRLAERRWAASGRFRSEADADPRDDLATAEARMDFPILLGWLDGPERHVVEAVFARGMLLREVALELGVTEQRASQIKLRALTILRVRLEESQCRQRAEPAAPAATAGGRCTSSAPGAAPAATASTGTPCPSSPPGTPR